MISDAKTGEIYGAHIIGEDATELIAEFGLAIELEATVEELHRTIHAHPTLSEAVMEAAAAAAGRGDPHLSGALQMSMTSPPSGSLLGGGGGAGLRKRLTMRFVALTTSAAPTADQNPAT